MKKGKILVLAIIAIALFGALALASCHLSCSELGKCYGKMANSWQVYSSSYVTCDDACISYQWLHDSTAQAGTTYTCDCK
jgi:hypothetical protein